MRLTPMRYKDYTWPHNPEVYQVECRREVAAHKVPFGGYVLQDLGETYRILQGEGEFVGEGAYEEYKALEQVFLQGGSGVLVHPVWPAARAYFVSLELTEEPLPDYVQYRVTFWEDQKGYAAGLKRRAEQHGVSVGGRGEREAGVSCGGYCGPAGELAGFELCDHHGNGGLRPWETMRHI